MAVSRPLPGRVLLLGAGLIVGLLLAEVLVRGVNYARSGTDRDRGGVERAYQQHDPVLGWRPIPGVTARHHTTEFDVSYAIGAHGFRQRDPPLQRGNREDGSPRPRVLVLGDSFVFGQGVAEEERFTERIAAALDIDVVAVGIPGSGTDQQLLLYEELTGPSGLFATPGPGSKPSVPAFDVVVLGFLLEAVERNADDSRAGRSKPRFVLDEAGALQLTGVPVPDDYVTLAERTAVRETTLTARIKGSLRRHSVLYGLLRARFREDLRAGSPATLRTRSTVRPERGWLVTQALLSRFADQVRESGADLVVAVIAGRLELDADHDEDPVTRVLELCEDLGVVAVDFAPALREVGSEHCYFDVDGHWTPRGHAIAASVLGREVLVSR